MDELDLVDLKSSSACWPLACSSSSSSSSTSGAHGAGYVNNAIKHQSGDSGYCHQYPEDSLTVDSDTGGFSDARADVTAVALGFLDVASLAAACVLNRKFRALSGVHDHWRCFVLQYFGVYYDDYMQSVEVRDALRWRRLFVYIRQVHHNVDKRRGTRRFFPQLLRPCAQRAPEKEDNVSIAWGSSSEASSNSQVRTGPRRQRRRRYRGSVELADNCNLFFWENGRTVQIARVKDGKVLREIDTGQTFRRYFHRLANVKHRLFVCLNDCIRMWDVHDPHKPPVTLPPAVRPRGFEAPGRPLELLVHRRRLILLESACCLMWDTDSLEFVCAIRHDEDPLEERPEERPSTRASSGRDENRSLEVQWMGDLIVTWVRGASATLRVWTLGGDPVAQLKATGPLVQVDVARVTWVSVRTLDHFILAALDARSVVSLWDSKCGFAPVFRFYCGCDEPFDLVLTQDFLAVINDSVVENRLDLRFWRLWLHPSFEAEGAFSIAEEQRAASVRPGGSPAGIQFAPQGNGIVAGATSDQVQKALLQELRPSAVPIRRLSIPDIDSYFASYRNFLNVCSFHKSGQESLAVYRSSSLAKKIFFPPAKHTKFEEWLALQVHGDGTVVLYDFRPGSAAFDGGGTPSREREVQPREGEADSTSRRTDVPTHARSAAHGCRSRNH